MLTLVQKLHLIGTIAKKLVVDESGLDELLRQIKTRKITEIKIGFPNCNIITNTIDAIRLEKALKKNNNRYIKSFTIGPEIQNVQVLVIILTSIIKYCQLDIFKITSDIWIPEGLLRNVLLSQQTTLQSLHIRSLTVKRRNQLTGRFCCSASTTSTTTTSRNDNNKNNNKEIENIKSNNNNKEIRSNNNNKERNCKCTISCQPIIKGKGGIRPNTKVNILCDLEVNTAATSSRSFMSSSSSSSTPTTTSTKTICDHNVVSRVIIPSIYSKYNTNLSSLLLAACNISNEQTILLAQAITTRGGGGGGIDELSLRMNPTIDITGVYAICAAPIKCHIDLSLCGFKEKHAIAIANGISSRTRSLDKLSLCANFEIGTYGLLQLLESNVCTKLQALDVSYCDLDSYTTCLLLNGLNMLNGSTTILSEIYLHGAKVNKGMVSNALATVLQNRHSPKLRVIEMNDPRDVTKVMSAKQLRIILHSIRNNYQIEQLSIQYIRTFSEETIVWNEIQSYLHMNQAGRRYLINSPPQQQQKQQQQSSQLLLLSSDSKYTTTTIQEKSSKRSVLVDVSKSKRKMNTVTEEALTYMEYSTTCETDDNNNNEDDWFEILAKAGQYDNLNVLYWIVRHGIENFTAYHR